MRTSRQGSGTRFGGGLAFLFVMVALGLGTTSCGSGQHIVVRSVEPGDLSEFVLWEGGVPLATITYMIVDTDPTQSNRSEDILLPSTYVEIPIRVEPEEYEYIVRTITEGELASFLYEAWDAYVDGTGDAGVNGAEFAHAVRVRHVDVATFLGLYLDSGLTIADYMGFLETMEIELGAADREEELSGLAHFLSYSGSDLGEFLEALTAAGWTPTHLWAHMELAGWSFRELTDVYGREVLGDASANLGSFFADLATGTPVGEDNPVVEALHLIWDIIKDNRPVAEGQGAFTAVLDSRDMDPLHYTGGTLSKGKHQRWHSTWYGLFDVVNIEFDSVARYGSRHGQYTGEWVPSAYVDFTAITALWPNTLNGTADVRDLYNAGTLAKPVPEFVIFIRITLSNLLGARQLEWKVTMSGSSGVKD